MAEQSYKSHRMYCDDPLYSDIEDAAEESDKSVSEWLRDASNEKLENNE